MTDLIVHDVDDEIIKALNQSASRHGVSVESEHRRILEQVLLQPPTANIKRKSFAEVLSLMPNIGKDSDFERVQDDTDRTHLKGTSDSIF